MRCRRCFHLLASLIVIAVTIVAAVELDALVEYSEMESAPNDSEVPHRLRRQTLEEARIERMNLRRLQERFAHRPVEDLQMTWMRSQIYLNSADPDVIVSEEAWEHAIAAALDGESPETSNDPFFDAARYRRTHHHSRKRGFAADELASLSCVLPDPCAPNGQCMEDLGCSCFNDATRGYWKGTLCDACVFGYAGANCSVECAGGACNPCSSNGQCNQGTTGDGTCSCYSDASRGYWNGADCSLCADNYYGSECKNGCPGVDVGVVCSGHGTCDAGSTTSSGACVCTVGFNASLNCAGCDDAHYGDSCQYSCQGYVSSSGLPCSGHGNCSHGFLGDGGCSCAAGWAGATCSIQCPNGGNCGGNGTCHDGVGGNGSCTCAPRMAPPNCSTCVADYAGAFCNISCDSMRSPQNGLICSGHGTCFSSDQVNPKCQCAVGYKQSTICAADVTVCPGDPPCSGHGTCAASGCSCDAGWDGPLHACETCSSAYGNSTKCSTVCPNTASGVCNAQGNCIQGACYCTSTVYCGTACSSVDSCPTPCATIFQFGPSCLACPGAGPSSAATTSDYQYACNGHGMCSSGTSGSGICACYFGYTGSACELSCPTVTLAAYGSQSYACGGPSRGYCVKNTTSGTATCKCLDGFAGTTCELQCPTINGDICSGNGDCDATTGVCRCDPEWSGLACQVPCMCNTAHGSCNATACASLTSDQFCSSCVCQTNFTGLCFDCKPGTHGLNCDQPCDNGTTVGTVCVCNRYFGTANCSVQCPFGSNGTDTVVCGGHGVCSETRLGDGTCTCDTNYYGSACVSTCLSSACSATLVNGQCNPDTGACECLSNATGYWALSSTSKVCDICQTGYWGPDCTELCSCNNHGSCSQNTGECKCFADASLGYFTSSDCSSCAAGYIGTSCTIPSVAISASARQLLNYDGSSVGSDIFSRPPSATTSVVAPRTSSLMVDDSSDFRQVYIAGTPLALLDATSTNAVSSALYFVGTSLTDNATGSNQWFSRACNSETRHVWRHNSMIFFLQEANCGNPPRVFAAPRPIAQSTLWGATISVWNMSGVAFSASALIRTRSATSQSTTAAPRDTKLYRASGNYLVFIMCNASFSAGTGTTIWSPGCMLIQLTFSTNSLTNVTVTNEQRLILPSTFYATDVAISPDSSSQTIAISGYKNATSGLSTTWMILVVPLGFTNLTIPTVISNSVGAACWPSTLPIVGTSSVPPTTIWQTACSYCTAAYKIQFVSKTGMLIAMSVADDTTDDTALVWMGTTTTMPASCSRMAWPSAAGMGSSTPTAIAFDYFGGIGFVVSQLSDTSPSILAKFFLNTTGTPHFALYGQYTFLMLFKDASTTEPEVIAALAVAPNSRLLYASTTYLTQIRVTVLLLYEVTAITPSVASISGTVLSLSGTGFALNALYGGGQPTCFFGETTSSAATPATVVSSTLITCPVLNLSTATSCSQQVVEVSLFNPYFGATSNQLSTQRAKIPQLTSVSPSRGNYSARVVTIYGIDFISSPYAVCRFTQPSGNPVYATATLKDSTRMLCTQPVLSVTDYVYLDLSLDQQIYATGTLSYIVVGPAVSIAPQSTPTVSIAARSLVKFRVSVATVDETGKNLGDLDDTSRTILLPVSISEDASSVSCVDSDFLQWRRSTDGYPWPPCRSNLLNNQSRTGTTFTNLTNASLDTLTHSTFGGTVAFASTTMSGVATFDPLFFYQPRAATIQLTFIAQVSGWTTTVAVVISAGDPYALKIKNLNALDGTTGRITIPSKSGTPLPEIIVLVVDSLANIVTTDSDIEVVASVLYFPDNCTYTPPTSTVIYNASCRGSEGSFTSRYSKATSSVSFADRIALTGSIHGANHYIVFTSGALISVVTPYIRTAPCSSTQYKVPLTTSCADCPSPGGICDGSETIKVEPGYWRAPLVATSLYACDKLSPVCNGSSQINGSLCLLGSTGPLCGVCDTITAVSSTGSLEVTYYGKSRLTDCSACDTQSINDAIFSVMALAIFVGLVVWSFCTLRTETTSDVSVVLRSVVNHVQATGQVGQLSTRQVQFLKNIFTVSSGSSTLSVRGTQFLECFQKQHHMSFSYLFYAIMTLPVLAIPVAFTVFGVIRMLKLTPLLSHDLKREIDLQETQLGPSGAFVSLKRKYPLFMVFTTTISVVIFTFYQTLIAQSASVLQCKDFVISEAFLSNAPYVTKSYLIDDYSIECVNGNSPFLLAGQIFAIGYGFGIPLTFIFGYRFMNGRLGMPALTRFMFMFLAGGYKQKFWFWQALIMIRKLLLVLVGVFVTDEQAQSAAGMWIMSVALALQLWLQPAEKPEHNTVEALSLAVITLSLNLGLIYYWPSLPSGLETTVTVILICLTMSGFVMLLVFLISPIRNLLADLSADLRNAIAGLKDQQDILRRSKKRKRERLHRAALMYRGDIENHTNLQDIDPTVGASVTFHVSSGGGGGIGLPGGGGNRRGAASLHSSPMESNSLAALDFEFEEMSTIDSGDDSKSASWS